MKIKFKMSWGNPPFPKQWSAIKITNIISDDGRILSLWYDSEERIADIRYINYDSEYDDVRFNGLEYDVDIKEINKCIIKIFTSFDEIE